MAASTVCVYVCAFFYVCSIAAAVATVAVVFDIFISAVVAVVTVKNWYFAISLSIVTPCCNLFSYTCIYWMGELSQVEKKNKSLLNTKEQTYWFRRETKPAEYYETISIWIHLKWLMFMFRLTLDYWKTSHTKKKTNAVDEVRKYFFNIRHAKTMENGPYLCQRHFPLIQLKFYYRLL